MSSGFGQFCPIAVASEVFAERWTPMILRELVAGSERFNDIHRGVPAMSRALLARRLGELEDAGVITKEPLDGARGHRYRLTAAGKEFAPILESLGRWGQRWTPRVQARNLDAAFLMWSMRRGIALGRLPQRRVVVCLRFSGVPRTHRGTRIFWLLMERTGVEMCIEDPGFEVDLQVEADLAAMTSVWLGDLPLPAALASKKVRILGPRSLTAAFPTWLLLSPQANVPRPAAAHGGAR